jgi:hypothetical protein
LPSPKKVVRPVPPWFTQELTKRKGNLAQWEIEIMWEGFVDFSRYACENKTLEGYVRQ